MLRQKWVVTAALLNAPFWVLFLIPSGWTGWLTFVAAAALSAWLVMRRSTKPQPQNPVAWKLPFGLNIGLAGMAAVTGSAAIAAAGALVWLYLWLRQRPDQSVVGTSQYLCLLPASVLLFGFSLTPLHQWSLACARWLLDHAGALYLLTDETFQRPGGRFSVDALSGGWAAPEVFLVMCAAICVLLRIRLLQLVPLIVAATGLAIFKGGLTFLLIAKMTEQSATAIGVVPAAIAGSLAAAVLLYFSFAALVLAVTEAVPLDPYQLNLAAIVWNRLFLRLPRAQQAATPTPSLRELSATTEIVPRVVVQWLREFGFTWAISRSRLRLAAAVPAVALLTFLIWWGQPESDLLATKYADQFDQALQADRLDDAAWLADRLQQMDSEAMKSRFVVARRLLQAGRTEDGIAKIREVTQLDRQGDPAARIWLVEQTSHNLPELKLTMDQQVQQLQKAIAEDSSEVKPFVLLAQLQERRQELHLAKAAWRNVVSKDLAWLPELLRLQKQLGESPKRIRRESASFVKTLQRQLADDIRNAELQVARVRVFYLLGQPEQAFRHLQTAMAQVDDPQLRQLMASVKVQEAVRLAQQPLRQQQTLQTAIDALEYDPANSAALDLLGVQVPNERLETDALQTALDHWQTESRLQPDHIEPLFRVCQLQMLTGQRDAAIATLEAHVHQAPTLRWPLAHAYLQADRMNDANPLLQQLQEELKSEIDAGTAAAADYDRYLGILLLQEQYANVIRWIDDYRNESGTLSDAMAQRYVSAVLGAVRQQKNGKLEVVSAADVQLLIEAAKLRPQQSEVLHLLAHTSYQQDAAGRHATQYLHARIASGRDLFVVYSILGAQAIVQEDYRMAVDALEKALRFRPESAIVQNNLAIALIRADPENGSRAIRLIDSALQHAPEFAELIATRGEILLTLKRPEEARRELNRVLQFDADHQLARALIQKMDSVTAQ